MGYVLSNHANLDENITAEVRGRQLQCSVTSLPFVPQRYYKPSK